VRAVNLIPDRHRRRVPGAGVKGGAYLVVGVLAVLLVMAVAYTLTANQANSRTTQAAEARQEAERYEARVAALGAYGNFSQIKATRVASVKQLAGARFDWERLLREISAILPNGSWLQEASASLTGEFEGSSGGADEEGKPGITLHGCAPRQSEVAKLMVRLRQVYLVEDVQLTESARGDASGPPTVNNCGSYLEFDLLVTFIASAPTGGEAPAGAKRVPARLGGGS
jgi:Tfp pilus assembly protein PilN